MPFCGAVTASPTGGPTPSRMLFQRKENETNEYIRLFFCFFPFFSPPSSDCTGNRIGFRCDWWRHWFTFCCHSATTAKKKRRRERKRSSRYKVLKRAARWRYKYRFPQNLALATSRLKKKKNGKETKLTQLGNVSSVMCRRRHTVESSAFVAYQRDP